MAILYEEAVKNDIKSEKLAPCYLLFGNDAYLKKFYFDSVKAKGYDGDAFFNLQCFADDFSLQELFDAVTQYPMMSDKKCVTVHDFDFEKASKSDFDTFLQVISQIGDGCTLVVRFDTVNFDVKKSSRAKKIIAECEKIGGKAVCLDHRTTGMLIKMIVNAVAKRGCKISENAAKYLIENSGDDICIIQNEIIKLCNFADGKEIDREMIEYMCVKTVEASVYDYVKKIFACDITSALNILDDMFYMRIEPIVILHTVSTTYIDTYRAYVGKKSGRKMSEVASDFGYKNRAFVLERALLDAKRFNREMFKLSFDALLEADDSLKSFSVDRRTVLEQLTVKLVYIIAKGESVDKA